jgi:hypothetical protein
MFRCICISSSNSESRRPLSCSQRSYSKNTHPTSILKWIIVLFYLKANFLLKARAHQQKWNFNKEQERNWVFFRIWRVHWKSHYVGWLSRIVYTFSMTKENKDRMNRFFLTVLKDEWKPREKDQKVPVFELKRILWMNRTDPYSGARLSTISILYAKPEEKCMYIWEIHSFAMRYRKISQTLYRR